MMRIIFLAFYAVIVLCGGGKEVQAAIHISPYVSFYMPAINVALSPGESHVETLYALKKNIELKVEGRVNGLFTDIVALICDEENLQKFLQKRPHACRGGKKQYGTFDLNERTYSDAPHYLVIHNPLDLLKPLNTKSIYAQTQIKYIHSPEDRAEAEAAFGKFMQALQSLFEIKDFSIRMEPCNARNAYSDSYDGDITICTEILGESILKNNKGIFGGVLLHELGHTALNLWGLPGWDNERTADEFATVMLIIMGQGSTDLAKEWIGFFDPSKRNVARQAEAIAQSVGPHPLDIQRIDAIQRIIDNPAPVIKRWNKILYPRMKTNMLQDIISGSLDIYGRDVDLAKEILSARRN